jgi:hypothetical protein
MERALEADNSTVQPGRLTQIFDLQEAADFVGRPITTLRYWIRNPPTGFPEVLRSGNRPFIRAAELERWALGTAAPGSAKPSIDPDLQPVKRGRGRPRKQSVTGA